MYGNKIVTAAVSAAGITSAQVLRPEEPQMTFLETVPFFVSKEASKFNMGTRLDETELSHS